VNAAAGDSHSSSVSRGPNESQRISTTNPYSVLSFHKMSLFVRAALLTILATTALGHQPALLPLRNDEGALVFVISEDGSVRSEGGASFSEVQASSLTLGEIGNVAEAITEMRSTSIGLDTKIQETSSSLDQELKVLKEGLSTEIGGLRSEILERMVQESEQRLQAQQIRLEAQQAKEAEDTERNTQVDAALGGLETRIGELQKSAFEKIAIVHQEIVSKIDAQQELLDTIIRIVTKLDFSEDVRKLAIREEQE